MIFFDFFFSLFFYGGLGSWVVGGGFLLFGCWLERRMVFVGYRGFGGGGLLKKVVSMGC